MTSLALVAITHDNAPFDLLERVALDGDDSRDLAARLVATPGSAEAVVLSTCNRTELYLAGPDPAPGAARAALAAHTGVPFADLARASLTLTDEAASLHLFRVACGLESRVVGEGHILGQVRSAVSRASANGTAGPHLNALFRFAVAAGRKTRRVSGANASPSLASVALDAAAAPAGGTTLVVGAGNLASAVVAELRARRVDYVVCARRPEQAVTLARRPDEVFGLDGLTAALERVDMVVCATSARTPLLRATDVADAMRRRAGRPLTIVDLSMPRNVEPAAADVPGTRVIDLEGVTSDPGQLQRRRAIQAIADEHRRYRTWLAGQAAGPAIVRLRATVHERCRAAAYASLATRGVDPWAIERAAHRIAAELLHGPTVALKDLVGRGDEKGARALLSLYGVEAGAGGSLLVPPAGIDELAVAS